MSDQDRIDTEENEVEAHRRHLNDERQGANPAAGEDATDSDSDDFELHRFTASPNPSRPNPA